MYRVIAAIAALLLVVVPVSAALPSVDTENSRTSPALVGESIDVGDYLIQVVDVDTDAWDEISAANSYNEPPTTGNVFVMALVETTYTGEETGNPWLDLSYQAVGNLNLGYDDGVFGCGVLPLQASDAPELFEGGTTSFNVCWEVSEAESSSLVMYVEELFAFDEARFWFSLDVTTRVEGTPEVGN